MLSLEDFFAKIYIPFDSEFLVAQDSSRSTVKCQEVTLTELYHVQSTQTLHKFHIGDWSSDTGLVWFRDPFIHSRRDLRGIIIKGALRPQVLNKALLDSFYKEYVSLNGVDVER
jgi:hypothetical protein